MSRSVCVVGSFMMDLAVRARRRPVAGETVRGTGFDMFLGGKGFNQAIAACRAGATTAMVGRLGADEFGHRFLDHLRREAIECAGVAVDGELGTGVGAPLIEETGENSIVIVPRANERFTPADAERATPHIRAADVTLIQLELPFESMLTTARIAHRHGVLVVLNPAPATDPGAIDELCGLVDVIVPNEVEARALCGAPTDAANQDVAAELTARWGVPVVMTVGAEGVVLAGDGSLSEIRGHAVRVVDTVGAGDAFCGTLGAWLSTGATLHDAVHYANAAGALAVTRHGAEPSMPSRRAIVELAQEPSGSITVPAERYATP